MEQLFIYLLKSSGLTLVFYLVYYFLLRKETFFANNRWFLLSGMFSAMVFPLLFIKKIVWVQKPKISVAELIAMSNQTTAATSDQVININWFEIATIGYGIVVTLLIIKLLIHILSLFKLLHNQQIEKHENYAIVDLNQAVAPFSFFNFIVFNSNLYSHIELKNILAHEKVHSHQKHSFDVLFSKLFCIIFWFNPFAWLYQKAILQNLEYIADSEAIQSIEDKNAYQKTLLRVVFNQNCLPITNHFYQSLIKKRIVMLNKNQSHKRNSWKYAVVVPALVAFVMLFQVKIIAQEKESTSSSENITTLEWTKDSPNSELDANIKKMAELGVTIKYSDLKRNDKGEIIAIKVTFDDGKGTVGERLTKGNKPMKPIIIAIKESNNKNTEIEFQNDFYNNEEANAEAPIAPTPPPTPDWNNMPSPPPAPNFPVFPNIKMPKNPNDKKAMEKYEAEMEKYAKKWESGAIKKYEAEMKAYEEKMKDYEPDMTAFDKEMEIFDKKIAKYQDKMESYQEKLRDQMQDKQEAERDAIEAEKDKQEAEKEAIENQKDKQKAEKKK